MSGQTLNFYYDINDPSLTSFETVIKNEPNYISHTFVKSPIYDSSTKQRIGYQAVDIYIQQVETDKFIVRENHTCYFDNNGTNGSVNWIYVFETTTPDIYYQDGIPVISNIVSTTGGYYIKNGSTGTTVINVQESGIRNVVITFAALCVGPDTRILLENSVYKKASELKRGDRIVQDIKTGVIKIISRVVISHSDNCVTIPKGLLGNTENVLITQNHPIWVNGDKNRIYPKHVPRAKKEIGYFTVYSIQFDEEGTFYAEGMKVDSISPNFYLSKLPKDQFINRRKHDKRCIIREEDDPRRGKPPMIDHL
jgi:hypothetical protein